MGGRTLRSDATPVERLRASLENVRPCGSGGLMARCPAHEDRENSLKIDEGDDGRALLNCFAGCEPERIVAALGWTMSDLFAPRPDGGGGGLIPPSNRATAQPPPGCTLAKYAEAKGLPLDRLRAFGLSDITYLGSPAVRIPYRDGDGAEVAVRFRVALEKADTDNRFRWKSGAKPRLYGRDRLAPARERGEVALVEGESDCHTLWHHDEPAVGVPGAANWRDARDAHDLDGIDVVYLVVEPDAGGDTLRAKLAASPVADRVRLIMLSGFKDVSAMHLDAPDRFLERWAAAKAAAVSLADETAAEARAEAAAALAACRDLAEAPDILALVANTLAASGVAGETRTLKLLYLIVTSRLLPRPASAAVKGPSSGGKSHAVERVLDLFPESAYYALSAMSERALAYSDEPLTHRMLVLYEAAGMSGDFASYLVRSLLSEGKVRYETVEKTADGLQARLIERPGPTGLLVTTTAVHLHPENETRMLSIGVTDTPDQTRAIFRALANGSDASLDVAPWHALQVWITGAEHRVVIPYADALAGLVSAIAVRLRRDFGLLLTLIRAHAILHQATRARDDDGRIIATNADYAAVRDLVADLIAEGVETTVPSTVRETVTVVRDLIARLKEGGPLGERVREDADRTASIAEVAKSLKLDRTAAWRRVRMAIDRGYLKNLEDKRGRPAKVALGDPLPEDVAILPTADEIATCCSDAGVSEGKGTPPPRAHHDGPSGRDWTDRGGGVGIPPNTDATLQPFLDAAKQDADPAILAWARDLAGFTEEELSRYRDEMAAAPEDEPPTPDELAALALAERMRQEAAA